MEEFKAVEQNNEEKKITSAQQTLFEQKQEQEERKSQWFQDLGGASIVYAIVYTFCLYQSATGISMTVWIGATIGYSIYIMRKRGVEYKSKGALYLVAMMLLGISTFITGNGAIIAMNYFAFFLLLVSFLLTQFSEQLELGLIERLMQLLQSVLGAIEFVNKPIEEGIAMLVSRKKEDTSKVNAVIVGVAVAIPVVVILGLCLSSADAVFRSLLESVENHIIVPRITFKIFAMFFFGFFSSYCGIRYLADQEKHILTAMVKKQNPIIAITFTSIITVLYIVFVGIQIIYLFLGYGTLPEGMSYATYARTGFFELLFVVVVNFILVQTIQRHFERQRLLDWVLLTICGCTFIMIGSSCYRMILYIQAYQLTFLRVFVLVSLFTILICMIGVVISFFVNRFSMYRYCAISVSVIYVVFSFSHIDYFIAKYNLSHMTSEQKSDMLEYVKTLSSDAAPVISNYIQSDSEMLELMNSTYSIYSEQDNDWVYSVPNEIQWAVWYKENILDHAQNMGIRGFNLSYYLAEQTMKFE